MHKLPLYVPFDVSEVAGWRMSLLAVPSIYISSLVSDARALLSWRPSSLHYDGSRWDMSNEQSAELTRPVVLVFLGF